MEPNNHTTNTTTNNNTFQMPASDEVWIVNYEDLDFHEEIGSGQFGRVFKADYFGAIVGVKKISKDPGQDKIMLKFIQREIEILKYNHPNIVTLIGVAEKDNDLYLVTEYCEGGDLCKYLRDAKVNLPWGIRVRMASDIACAMAYLHAKNITHRDLKSQNCLVTENWRVKLCDFGFARKVTGVSQPAFMTLCGTDDFMSPEIILGEDYDERSDIFSYGLLLCEIIIRKRICDVLPRSPATFFGVEEKMFWSQIPKDCPPAFSQLAWSCCAYYPKDRPPFKEVMSRLRAIEKEVLVSSPGMPTIDPPQLEKKKSTRTPKTPERKLMKYDSVPITVGEPGSEVSEASDFVPEPSPRRKKDKQAVLKQLVEEFFKRRDKTEKKDKKKEKEHKEKEHKEKEDEDPKSPRRKLAFSGELKKEKDKDKDNDGNTLKFSGEVGVNNEKDEMGGNGDDEKKLKRHHRISLNLAGVLGQTEKEKRNARRSIAVGKTMAPDVAEAKG